MHLRVLALYFYTSSTPEETESLQCVAERCGVLQCVAVCGGIL